MYQDMKMKEGRIKTGEVPPDLIHGRQTESSLATASINR